MTTTFTNFFRFGKPDFLSEPWSGVIQSTFDQIDTALQNAVGALNVTSWTNATTFSVDQTRIDTADGTFWICQVAHTSANSPTTFAQDRAAHPTFWANVALSIRGRGQWLQNTPYALNDLVYDITGGRAIFAICKIAHTSNNAGGGTINTDIANWTYLFNGTFTQTAAAITYDHTVSGLVATQVQAAIDEIVVALGNRLRFDTSQSLSGGQKTQALTNLGISGSVVVSSRAINTSAPLAGGGDLSADRTHSLTMGATLSLDVPSGQLRTIALSGDVTSAANSFATTVDTKFLQTGVTKLITKGFTVTPFNIGTITSGTTTLDPTQSNYQFYTNGGAHTIAAPSADCAIDILITNNASAGAITFSGFTVSANTGDALTTTNTNKFVLSVRRINGVSTYTIKALQ